MSLHRLPTCMGSFAVPVLFCEACSLGELAGDAQRMPLPSDLCPPLQSVNTNLMGGGPTGSQISSGTWKKNSFFGDFTNL